MSLNLIWDNVCYLRGLLGNWLEFIPFCDTKIDYSFERIKSILFVWTVMHQNNIVSSGFQSCGNISVDFFGRAYSSGISGIKVPIKIYKFRIREIFDCIRHYTCCIFFAYSIRTSARESNNGGCISCRCFNLFLKICKVFD